MRLSIGRWLLAGWLLGTFLTLIWLLVLPYTSLEPTVAQEQDLVEDGLPTGERETVPLNQSSSAPGEETNVPPEPISRRPDRIHGVYLNGWCAGSPEKVQRLLKAVEAGYLNTVVIEIKDDTGLISYPSRVPLALALGAAGDKIADPQALLTTLHERGVYVIARLCVFKDSILAGKRPETSIYGPNGQPWRDAKGLRWVDPYDRQAWTYNVDIAVEAAQLGFDEIQFDYVRFPDTPHLNTLRYPDRDSRTRVEVIRDFLAYARERLAPLGVRVSADVFGLVTSSEEDLGIGQRLEELAEVVDYLSPMIYPSHYYRGEYGLADPEGAPYTTVYYAALDGVLRLKTAGYEAKKLVPWLQDFSLRKKYGPQEILYQIKALQDVGVEDWYLWNAGSQYTWQALADLKNGKLATLPPERPAKYVARKGDRKPATPPRYQGIPVGEQPGEKPVATEEEAPVTPLPLPGEVPLPEEETSSAAADHPSPVKEEGVINQ